VERDQGSRARVKIPDEPPSKGASGRQAAQLKPRFVLLREENNFYA
jgi:hypothetical protein